MAVPMALMMPGLVGGGATLGAAAGGGAAAGAGGLGIGAILAKLGSDPVWGSLMAEMGTGLVNKFLGLGGASPYEQANQSRLDAAQSVLPDLKKAAAGLPTASSDALMRQVRREGTAMQQSMAASARGSGALGGTPQGGSIFRAQSERIQGAQQEAMAQSLGQHQIAAQQMLMGQLGPSITQASQFANQDLQFEVAAKTALGRLGRKYAENPNDDLINRFIAVLEKLGIGGEALGEAGGGANTPTPGLSAPNFRPPSKPSAQFGFPAPQAPFAQQFKQPITRLGVGG